MALLTQTFQCICLPKWWCNLGVKQCFVYLLVSFAAVYLLLSESVRVREFQNRSQTLQHSTDLCVRATIDNCTRITEQCQFALRGYEQGGSKKEYNSGLTAQDYFNLSRDCSKFRSRFAYYSLSEMTTEERDYPIAFSILMYENFEQLERLLRLIYRPVNYYCIHVDKKSDVIMHKAAARIATCLPGVVIATPAVSVTWGEISLVYAERLCMQTLVNVSRKWTWYISLVGRDFPLRTNWEIVQILKLYNGSSDIEGTRKVQFYPQWFQYVWKNYEPTEVKKTKPPHGYVITKGSPHFAATRQFVEFALSDAKAHDLLLWMKDIKIPDEHFLQTLQHNSKLGAPGAFAGDPDSRVWNMRAKRWWFNANETCAGEWVREVCNIGVGDLPWVISSPKLFVNKIRLEVEPVAFQCLEMWYQNRVRCQLRRGLTFHDVNFNLTFYVNRTQ